METKELIEQKRQELRELEMELELEEAGWIKDRINHRSTWYNASMRADDTETAYKILKLEKLKAKVLEFLKDADPVEFVRLSAESPSGGTCYLEPSILAEIWELVQDATNT